jgi:hypothetical protein
MLFILLNFIIVVTGPHNLLANFVLKARKTKYPENAQRDERQRFDDIMQKMGQKNPSHPFFYLDCHNHG